MNNFEKFYEHVKKHVEDNGIKIKKGKGKFLRELDGACSGYFDEETLAVAWKNPLASEIFTHEYAHFLQWIEDAEVWTNSYKYDMWEYLRGDPHVTRGWNCTLATIALERDCEIRAIKLGKKWDLFDVEEYARKANAYLYFYQWVMLNHAWKNSSRLHASDDISDMMPTKILPLSKFETVDMNMMLVYDKILG